MSWFDYIVCFLTLIAGVAGAIQVSYNIGFRMGARSEALKRAEGCKCMRKQNERKHNDRRQ